jgi:hypothetical protein
VGRVEGGNKGKKNTGQVKEGKQGGETERVKEGTKKQ